MCTTYENNLKRLKDIAAQHGLTLNPDSERIRKGVALMAANFDAVAEWICPCKQQHKPPRKGMDATCPCPEWIDDIRRDGHCFCRLFFAR